MKVAFLRAFNLIMMEIYLFHKIFLSSLHFAGFFFFVKIQQVVRATFVENSQSLKSWIKSLDKSNELYYNVAVALNRVYFITNE